MNPETVVFDRYQLRERIGTGGTSVVWKATDRLLCQTVALKHVSFTALDTGQAQLTRGRTLREARLAAKLRGHPHVVAVYDVRVNDGDIWLVMEYVPARSLSELLRAQGGLDPLRVARIGAQIADALAAGHVLGIEHRDVKPGNVLITADDTVKLTDYGISHFIGEAQLTHTGKISGTPAYLAPEVATNGESSPASDVFSLGATLYAAVECRPPFGTDDNILRLLDTVRTGVFPPPTAAGPLEPILLRLMQRDPWARPTAAAAAELLARLASHPTGPTERTPPHPWPAVRPWWRRRPSVLAAMTLAALLVAGMVGMTTRTDPTEEAQPTPDPSPASTTPAPPAATEPVTTQPPTRAAVADDTVTARSPTAQSPTAKRAPRGARESDPCAMIDFGSLTPFNQAQAAESPMNCPVDFGP